MAIHPEFVSLTEICQNLIVQMNYATTDNFTGGIVPGYKSVKGLLAKGPAEALARVQDRALKQGLSLKIFDSYRPLKAVQYFQDWARLPESNKVLKARFYPHFERMELFEKGFIARQSSHSRGAAVDLTIVERSTGKELDMGTEFDYFHELSHTENAGIAKEQRLNRLLLKNLMESEGFKNFYQEWWHYSFRPEPFPGRSFDFDIE